MSDEFDGNQLPPFPVDDATLDMLWAAMYPRENGNPDAESSSVWDLLGMFSELGGSDIRAVQEQLDDSTFLMRDQHYHEHDVLAALITEVRRLRGEVPS